MVQDRLPTLDVNDYEAIEEAVMETARGRWFLAEFARRQRSAEMAELRQLLLRLEAKLPSPPTMAPLESKVQVPPPRLEVTSAPPITPTTPVPPKPPIAQLRLQKPAGGLTLAMIDAMPALEKIALFA